MLLSGARLQSYEMGSVYDRGGNECAGVEIVKSGRARVYISSPNGRELTLYRLYDGDFCMMSVACMLKNINFSISIKMETACEIVRLSRESYKKLLDTSLTVKNFTMELIASKFTDVMWLFEQTVFSNMDSRIAGALMERSAMDGSKIIEITHEKIAADLGTAREVVTRQVKKFQLEGLISMSRGKIEILDEKTLIGKII